MEKRIVLCADDYGQAPSISAAIRDLIEKQRLSATSCLVNFPGFLDEARALSSYQDQIDIGLHFNLTEGKPLSDGDAFPSLFQVLSQSLLGRINLSFIEAECHAQLDQFITAMGRPPDFIDGHQHVHQFPLIRDVVLRVYISRLAPASVYVRWVNDHQAAWIDPPTMIKKWIIQAAGTRALKRLLDEKAIPHNQSFAGIYSFKGATRKAFQTFLRRIGDRGMIMCHPGFQYNKQEDKLHDVRFREHAYLASDDFIEDCRKAQVRLGRFSLFLP